MNKNCLLLVFLGCIFVCLAVKQGANKEYSGGYSAEVSENNPYNGRIGVARERNRGRHEQPSRGGRPNRGQNNNNGNKQQRPTQSQQSTSNTGNDQNSASTNQAGAEIQQPTQTQQASNQQQDQQQAQQQAQQQPVETQPTQTLQSSHPKQDVQNGGSFGSIHNADGPRVLQSKHVTQSVLSNRGSGNQGAALPDEEESTEIILENGSEDTNSTDEAVATASDDDRAPWVLAVAIGVPVGVVAFIVVLIVIAFTADHHHIQRKTRKGLDMDIKANDKEGLVNNEQTDNQQNPLPDSDENTSSSSEDESSHDDTPGSTIEFVL